MDLLTFYKELTRYCTSIHKYFPWVLRSILYPLKNNHVMMVQRMNYMIHKHSTWIIFIFNQIWYGCIPQNIWSHLWRYWLDGVNTIHIIDYFIILNFNHQKCHKPFNTSNLTVPSIDGLILQLMQNF